MKNKKIKKSEFRFRGKDLGIEKLKLLELAYDDIEDYDIEYLIIDDSGEILDSTDWVGEALNVVLDEIDEKLMTEIKKPWHIQIVNVGTHKDITKSRFRKLFGDALLLEYREKRIMEE